MSDTELFPVDPSNLFDEQSDDGVTTAQSEPKERRRRRTRRALSAGERYRLAEWIKGVYEDGDPQWTERQWIERACALLEKDVSWKSVLSTAEQCFDIKIAPQPPDEEPTRVLADAYLKIEAVLTHIDPKIWDTAGVGRPDINRLQRIANKS